MPLSLHISARKTGECYPNSKKKLCQSLIASGPSYLAFHQSFSFIPYSFNTSIVRHCSFSAIFPAKLSATSRISLYSCNNLIWRCTVSSGFIEFLISTYKMWITWALIQSPFSVLGVLWVLLRVLWFQLRDPLWLESASSPLRSKSRCFTRTVLTRGFIIRLHVKTRSSGISSDRLRIPKPLQIPPVQRGSSPLRHLVQKLYY